MMRVRVLLCSILAFGVCWFFSNKAQVYAAIVLEVNIFGSPTLVRIEEGGLINPVHDVLSTPKDFTFLFNKVPPEDQNVLLTAFRIAKARANNDSALGLFILEKEKGACGESSRRLTERLAGSLPETWTIRQIRSVVGTRFEGSIHQTTLLSSPSGKHYLIDISMGYVQIAIMDQVESDPPRWIPARGEELVFTAFLLGGQLNPRWELGALRLELQGACRVPEAEKSREIEVVAATDPNDKAASQGAGDLQFLSGEEPLRYAVFFENIPTATAPAQVVEITDQLDTVNMDLDSFSLGPIAFGDKLVTPPPGLSEFATDVDLRPEKNLIVRIEAGLDFATGIVTWRFSSIDPDTGEPLDPADPDGFLPPNVNPPEGDGSVLFFVNLKAGLPTNTQICNQATIVFDVNPPIDTPQRCNTMDNTPPESQVLPLDLLQENKSFLVEWSGTDVGSGILDFTVFVSEDGGPFTTFVANTPETLAPFTGELGRTYAFCSIARDQAGNVEEKGCPPNAEATTFVPEDLCPEDPDKNDPGLCGCGVPEDSDGDGVADCQDLVSGGKGKRTDCFSEWVVTNPNNPRDKKGFPTIKQSCVDGDPSCDFDILSGQCTFMVGLCLNVGDPRLVDREGEQACMPEDVAEVDTSRAPELRGALVDLGGSIRGKCKKGRRGEVCLLDSQCDTEPGKGDGKCEGEFVVFDPPLMDPLSCTETVPVKVLLEVTGKGKEKKGVKRLRIVTSTSPGGKKRKKDPDVLKLTCLPASP